MGTTTATAARTRARLGFWTVTAGFFLVMSFMTVPTPLYGLYEQRDGFGSFTVTLVFAAYGVGVVAGLLLLGHVSDHVGRRPVLLGVVVLEVVVAVGFSLFADTGALLALRFLSGLGVGGFSATATAQVGELHERWRPGSTSPLARTAANGANLGGLAAGALAGGLLSLLPGALSAPYAVFVVLLVVAGVLVALAPETVPAEVRARRWRYRPQRVSIDPEVRTTFAGAAVAALAGFTVLGFVGALSGVYLADVVGTTSRVAIGAVATGVLSGGVVSQVLLRDLPRRGQLRAGAGLVAVGAAVMIAAALLGSLVLYVVGGFVASGGVGLVFAASVATVAGLAAPERRGETLAALFLAAYVGITVPVVLIGAALTVASVVTVLVAFALVLVVAVPAGIAVVLRTTADD